MAGKSATLTVKIVTDAKQAAAGFADAEAKTAGFQKGLERAAVGMAAASAGLVALGRDAYDAASALQQSSGAIETVFGASSDVIAGKAREAAQAVGLSANAYQELAATMGSQLRNMGIATDQLAPKTDQLIRLGADLAATYGGTTADAVAALSSLLRGETDPIERYGVSIKQADIAARLAAQGMDGLEGPAAKAAQAQAVLGLIAAQTGAAVGAFGREADTAAGQTQRAAAEWENAKAALGEALLPVVSDAAEKFSGLAGFLSENKDLVSIVVPLFIGLTAAVWALNFALAANPIVLIAMAVAALILGLVVLIVKFKGVRDFILEAFRPVISLFEAFWNLIVKIKDGIATVARVTGLDQLFGAPVPAVAAAAGPGVYGAPIAGAPLIAGAAGGGVGPSGGSRSTQESVVNITVNGALDPVAVGRQVDRLTRKYGQVTGRTVTARAGR